MQANLLSDNPYLSISFSSGDDHDILFDVTFGPTQVNCKVELGGTEAFILGLGEDTSFTLSPEEVDFLTSEYNKRRARYVFGKIL